MSKKVALALSSGGARGLAHVGVIEELESVGYVINSISGSSMGAMVGAMYAAGTLKSYKKWALGLSRIDVIRLVDITIGSKGFIKGEKLFEEMERLGFIPDINIEDLSIPLTILATDIINYKEVVFREGNLAKALRASVAIPNVLTPIKTKDGLWVDGGVLNPLPLGFLDTSNSDYIVAVNTNALIPYNKPLHHDHINSESDEEKSLFEQFKARWFEFFEGDEKRKLAEASKIGYFDLLYRVVQVMMNSITQQALNEFPPDLLVSISKDACGVFEFYRAKEIIENGRNACKEALKKELESRV
jgi:NTE family protein